ncbi:Patatin-like phospholipase [Rickettsia bellii RML369-C]|uniref:Patatin-like phospholipase n=1 Tax=Rickettsia bellii (strain RML369-C) TaxID=336407 RepID=Q1RI91_RICBR|nr:Patatin-like phospholipase [Rickettsia bellii RML369-C]
MRNFMEKNPDLKEDIEQFLQKAKSYTLEEVKERVVNFEQASLKWQEEQAKDDMLSSCAIEALKEDIELEGEEHTDDVGYNEIMV